MDQHDSSQPGAWLQAVFEKYESPLLRYASRLVGELDRGRDVVQDVFLKLCNAGPEKTDEHLAAWLYTTCRNRAFDVRKKEQRVNRLPPSVADKRDDANDPAKFAEHNDTFDQIQSLIETLPVNQQEVIRLKFEHGLKYREISEVTGLSVSNVGYLLHQGLVTLRKHCPSATTE